MKVRNPAQGASLPEILEEVKQTVLVYLTPEGIELMRATPFVRKGGYLACRAVCDSTDANYLYVDARYYGEDHATPRYTYLGIPHRYVLYLAADDPTRMQKPSRQK